MKGAPEGRGFFIALPSNQEGECGIMKRNNKVMLIRGLLLVFKFLDI